MRLAADAGLPSTTSVMLAYAPRLTLLLLFAPVVAGLAGTILPAFGYLPSLDQPAFGLDAWRQLLALPGLWTSVRLSLVTGFATTLVSVVLVMAFCAAWHGTRLFAALEKLLSPLLSVPHVTVAFGLAFLVAPSGWILRLLSPWATGFNRPPDWLILQDPNGLSLMLGLIVKEVPFLLLMTLAALGQTEAERGCAVARSLGYRPTSAWLKAVFPRVYPQIRLPIFAVLAFGVSVVDVAIVLAPTTPAPLAVRLVRMFNDPDLSLRLTASAGALLQCGLVAIGLVIWCGLEVVVRRWGVGWITRGHRGGRGLVPRWGSSVAMGALAAGVAMALVGMVAWSFATHWRFPDALPAGLTFANWARHGTGLAVPLLNTLTVAASSTALALTLALAVLEHEARSGRRSWVSSLNLLYLPLVLPQVAFLFGAQVLLAMAHLDGRWVALIGLHLVFVFPYVFLSLSDSYRAWDQRYHHTASCLGATRARVFLRVKVPMLLRPIATSAAVGFAVSVGLYLPTLFAGAGRYPTLTTEAVALSAGGDNRLIGIYSLVQMAFPLAGFALALALPAWRFRNRRGMQVVR